MIEIQVLRQDAENIIPKLESKLVSNASEIVKEILGLDEKRRTAITEVEQYKQQMNKASKSIGQLMKQGKKEEANAAKNQTAELKANIKSLEQQVQEIEQNLKDLLVRLPNIPDPSVPVGKNADDNQVLYQNDVKIEFDFDPLPHWELARTHNIIDWDMGSKITGAGFPVYIGKGAQLQRALISYFLSEAGKAGYTELQVPLMVNEDSGFATGQLPDKEGQMYHATMDNFYLIPTAEVPITNMYRDMILTSEDLPVKLCGYTPCFRREAGSYGKDVRGLNRLHQFDKVEIVQLVHPEKSYEVLEEMSDHVAMLLESLKLPYRKLLLCTGDMTFTSAKTYDMEVMSAGQDRWLEVSSISNFETYQSNRLKLRFKDDKKKTRLTHTLNGSALALPRIVAAVLENNQLSDGRIRIPDVLQPFTGFEFIGA